MKKFNFGDFVINFFLVALFLCAFLAILVLAIGAIGAVFEFSAVLGWLLIGLLLLIGVIAYYITIKENN